MAFVNDNQDVRLGSELIDGSDFTKLASVIFTEQDFAFASEEEFVTNADYLTEIAAKNLIPSGELEDSEDMSNDMVMSTSGAGYDRQMMPTVMKLKLALNYTEEQRKVLKGMKGRKLSVFLVDHFNNVKGVRNSDGSIRGFKIKSLIVDFKQSSDKPELTYAVLQFSNSTEFDNAIVAMPDWYLSELKPIQKVKLTCGAVAANDFTFTVAYESTSRVKGSALLTAACTGIVTANLEIKSSAGAVRVKTVAAGTIDGSYTSDGTAVVATDTAQIVPTSSNLYESDLVTLA